MSRSTLYRSFAALVPLVVAGSVVTGVSATASSGAPDLAPGSSNAAPAVAAPTSPSAAAERKSEVPQVVTSGQASRTGALPTTQMVRLALGLHPTNQGAEAAYLQAVQDKKSPQFHKFMTLEQWNANFAPTVADEQAVVSWAEAQGLTVTQRYSNRLIVDLEGNVSTVSKAFGVSMSGYRLGAQSFFSSDSAPVLPTTVSTAVASVSGLSNFGQLKPASPTVKEPTFSSYVAGPIRAAGRSAGADANPSAVAAMHKAVAAKRSTTAKAGGTVSPSISGGAYDPTDIYSSQAYNTNGLNAQGHCCNPTHLADAPAQDNIAIATAGTQDVADMQGFHNAYPYLAYSLNEINIDGTGPAGDGEGTMDMEWATAMANSFGSFHDTSHIYMYDGVNASFSTFIDIWNQMLSDNLARTMSTSWGCAELTCWGLSNVNTVHNIFSSMVGVGWTLLAAAGDQGAYTDLNPAAKTVSFPASDPNVLASGGTTLTLAAGPVYQSETAWGGGPAGAASNDGGGGGGCSSVFVRPSYQSAISLCGPSARALPDVSLNADWFNTPQNMYMGGLSGNGGTSIVAPELAGFFAQSNSYLLFDGHGPQGSPLPQLYSIAAGASPHNPYYDITSGCTSNDIGPGFCGIVGYDRATGWGSLNMLQMAWALNWQDLPDAGRPVVTYSGPATGHWYNTNQVVSWSVADTGTPASGVAGYSYGWDSVPADPNGHATPGAGDAFFGPMVPNGTTGALNLSSAGQGCHTAEVEAWDNMGFQSGVANYGSLCYDTVAPTAPTTAPQVSIFAGGRWTAAGVQMNVSWGAATDSLSGVGSYTLLQSQDNGAFVPIFTGNALSTTISLKGGHTYKFETTATDLAGNVSVAKVGTRFKVTVLQENASSIAYSTGWSRVAQAGASRAFVDRTSGINKTAKLTFTGTQFGWMTTQGSTHGSANVSFDGGGATAVNTNATTTQTALIAEVQFAASGSHTYQVKALGTTGHPMVDVDGFVIISNA